MIGEQVPSPLMEAQKIKTRRPSDEEWESHKELIGRLYIAETSTIRTVMNVLSQHGFEAR
jgi:hypothetical protein